MKSRNKVLSLIMAFCMLVGITALPTKMLSSAFAASSQSATVASTALTVLKVDKEYDLTLENSKLTYYDYCTTSGAEVVVWSPTGDLLRGNWHTYASTDVCSFTSAGLYAMQFRHKSNNIYTYSDVIYIAVSNSIANIEFNSDLKNVVKPGTVVTIPTAKEQSVTVKVFSPYGQEVSVTNNKFTNIENILGTYYIEYSLSVNYEGLPQDKLVYKTITFDASSQETNPVKEQEKQETTPNSSEYKLVVSGVDLAKEEKYLYLYKYYNLSTAYFANPSGEKVADADVFVTVYDDTNKKYYNFTSGQFETSTSNESKKNINSIGTEFILRDIDHLTSMEDEGNLIKVTYTVTYGGKNYEQVIDRTEKFNFNAISAKTKELSASEVTDIVLKTKVESTDFNLGVIEFSGVDLVIEKGYDGDALKTLISSVNLAATNSLTGTAFTSASSTPREDGKEGIDVINNGGLLNDGYKLFYNTYATKEFHFVMAYSINFQSTSNSEFNGTKRIEFRTYARETSKDTIKPHDMTIADYVKVVTSQSWVVPSVTVKDTDCDSNETTGAIINLSIQGTGSTYPTLTDIEMGSTLNNLTVGIYTVTITATDYVGNVRTKVIHFEVKNDAAVNVNPSLTLNNMTIIEDEKNVKITGVTSAEYVVIYTLNNSFSPKTIYTNGAVSEIEFEMPYIDDETKESCVAVFAVSNAYSTVYKGVQVHSSVNEVKATSIGILGSSSAFKVLVPNSTVKAKILENYIWFGNNSFTIETEENGKYIITDNNEIRFLTSGNYVIKSTEVIDGNSYEAETTITVSDAYSSFTVDFPIGQKQVVAKGETVNVKFPYVKGYYGYKLEVFVTDSKGNVVAEITDENDPKFVAAKTDVYRINYKISSDNIPAKTSIINVSTGNTNIPTITIAGINENVIWSGETIKYIIQDASSVDKNGNKIDVSIYCYDANGASLLIKTDKDGKKYVEVKDAGIYTIYYASKDVDGIEAISKASFAVEFPEEEEKSGVSVWSVLGIVFASLLGAAVVTFAVLVLVKNQKSKTRFINKNKQVKKQEKQERSTSQSVITISESKDEKHWFIKKNGRQIGKENSKIDAIKKAKELDATGASIIKVYNKNGRLVDSL